jgi:hypothetical protein
MAPLQPVPASGTFTCGSLIFSNFSDNIVNGGLIGATWLPDPLGGFNPCPTGTTCTGAWPHIFVLFEVQPASTAIGWSYSVTGTDTPIKLVQLPLLNHVVSGDPSVTEHFGDSVVLTASGHSGSGYAFAPASVFVQVNPSDITGGTISALDTIFVTPEPISLLFVSSGLIGIMLYRRFRA